MFSVVYHDSSSGPVQGLDRWILWWRNSDAEHDQANEDVPWEDPAGRTRFCIAVWLQSLRWTEFTSEHKWRGVNNKGQKTQVFVSLLTSLVIFQKFENISTDNILVYFTHVAADKTTTSGPRKSSSVSVCNSAMVSAAMYHLLKLSIVTRRLFFQ